MPEYLYKFISLEDETRGNSEENKKRFRTLSNNEIWFSVPMKLNDPYEFRGVYVDYDKMKGSGVSKSEVDDLQHMFEEEYVLSSFSEGMIDSFPMWAHYANNHLGFCVKYKIVDDKRIRKVKYVKQRPDITDSLSKAIFNNEKLKDPSLGPMLRELIMGLQAMFMRVLEQNYTVKHESWSYEKEYRIIYERSDKCDTYGQNVTADDVGLCIEALYTGYRCSVHDRIKEIALKLGVPCYKCQLDEKDYLIFTE